ncbi:MAG: MATE family efflux transporter [Bacteroidota bacterium]
MSALTLKPYLKEFPYNLKLAYPVVLGMLGHTLVAFADNIMVGQLGTAELAAVSLGNSVVLMFMYVGIGFSTAITPLVAEADGAQDAKSAKQWLKHGILLCLVLGMLLFGAIMACKPLLYLAKQPEEVVELAVPYLNIVAFSIIPMIVFQAFRQFSEGLSQTKFPMYATILANVLNILLNYLLIFGNFGFPKMGIVGAAVGTLVSRVVMLGMLYYLLWSRKRYHSLVTRFNFKVLQRTLFRKLVDLGFPSAMQVFFEVALFTSAIWLSGVLGKNPQAANQIALNLSSMTYMVGVGLSVAAMVRVGNQKGKQDYFALRTIALSIFLLTFLVEVVFAAIFLLGKDWLPTIYLDLEDIANRQDNMEVVLLAAKLLLVAAFFQISDGIQVVVLGALRGLQDVKVPTLLTFVAYWLVGFPISYYLGLYTPWKSMGIWIGLLSGLTVSALLLYLRFHKLTKKQIVGMLGA